MNALKNDLRKLYSDASKHSIYQSIPDFVSSELGYTESIDEKWRGDRPRLDYLLAHRRPMSGETWLDFGANTGFFTLSLAEKFPETRFIAVEANANHEKFISSIAQYFRLDNVETIQRSVGLAELATLPKSDLLLHLNVLHHAGHDFDAQLVPTRSLFPEYAQRYLRSLRESSTSMLFQIGSNWGGDKSQPLVGVREEAAKIQLFSEWLRSAGWRVRAASHAVHGPLDQVLYQDLSQNTCAALTRETTGFPFSLQEDLEKLDLDRFPGEFYRRPLFLCDFVERS